MRFSAILSLSALAALTAAAPHANLHHHRALAAPIAGRSILDGKCGGPSGDKCGPGYCCSEWGYCGTTAGYCGAGCQSAFGTCGSNSAPQPAPPAKQSTTSIAAVPTKDHPRPTVTYTHQRTLTVTSSKAPAPPATTLATAYSTPSVAPVHTNPSPTYASPAPSSTGSTGSGNTYKVYNGDGTTGAGWPSQDSWMDFESMWSANLRIISISCAQFGEPNNSDQESSEVKSAIQSVSSSSGVDPRFILAIMMQESKGCVRAPTTNYGVRNPGLMQSHDGSGTCNDGSVSNPCPSGQITQMINDGAAGTAAGDGLKQTIAQAHCSDVSQYYKAARIYNSGSIAAGGNLGQGIATHCYSSDIANRLTGWVDAPTSCNL